MPEYRSVEFFIVSSSSSSLPQFPQPSFSFPSPLRGGGGGGWSPPGPPPGGVHPKSPPGAGGGGGGGAPDGVGIPYNSTFKLNSLMTRLSCSGKDISIFVKM